MSSSDDGKDRTRSATDSSPRDRVQAASGLRRPRGLTWVRPTMIVLHRYVGLTIATFLFFAAVTGCVAVFRNELDEWINPELFLAQSPPAGADRLELLELRRQVQAQLPAGLDLFEVKLS